MQEAEYTHNLVPSIQHNIPITKGGKHELGNISVICKKCNVSIRNEVTGDLNSDEVIKVWSEINVSKMDTQVRLGKVRLGKDSIDKRTDKPSSSHFQKPSLEEVAAYCKERGSVVSPHKWYAHYESNGWKVGKNSMKDWRAAVRTWEPDNHRPPVPRPRCKSCGEELVDSGCRNLECLECPLYDPLYDPLYEDSE
jgi:hypothetical protein